MGSEQAKGNTLRGGKAAAFLAKPVAHPSPPAPRISALPKLPISQDCWGLRALAIRSAHHAVRPFPLVSAPSNPALVRGLAVLIGSLVALIPGARASVALLGGAAARPLGGQFNSVPVLHSNQPEEVEGPGILIDTGPGSATAAESGEVLANASYRFNGPFGLHAHHIYSPAAGIRLGPGRRRSELTLAVVLTNPSQRAVVVSLERGAVRNSFEAPYLGANLMGVKPLGPRPWNTGPGDATAVQMLRGRLDANLRDEITIPPLQRVVLLSTALPALGVANALLRGHSNGPIEMAVVAAPPPGDQASVLATLDSRQLAPGRTYLGRIAAINARQVFARVGGVALGDAYTASLSQDLEQAGALHVPLTSTDRTHFGSGEVQVNPLVSRMVDSSLDNVGTYGVRYDIDLNLRGQGAYALILSHPVDPNGGRIIAFRGSIAIRTAAGQEDVHVGMRSGESLTLTTLQLQRGTPQTVRLSLVYPADSTPGHLLSVVSLEQLAEFRQRQSRVETARLTPETPPPINLPAPAPQPRPSAAAVKGRTPRPTAIRPLKPPKQLGAAPARMPLRPPAWTRQSANTLLVPQPLRPGPRIEQSGIDGSSTLAERYRQAVEAQERMMGRWSTP
jgi:hypothetical protein